MLTSNKYKLKLFLSFLIILGSTILDSCTSCSSPQKLIGDRSRYLAQRGPSKDTVIVFVHGVLGDSKLTWSPDDGKTTFPGLLSEDPQFNYADIFVVEYDTGKTGKKSSIPELAQQLKRDFFSAGIFEQHKTVIFICHSMGGLVIREFLLSNRQYIPKVALSYFYGTPTTGSAIGQLATYLSANSQFGDMVPIQDNSLLKSMLIGWSNSPKEIYC